MRIFSVLASALLLLSVFGSIFATESASAGNLHSLEEEILRNSGNQQFLLATIRSAMLNNDPSALDYIFHHGLALPDEEIRTLFKLAVETDKKDFVELFLGYGAIVNLDHALIWAAGLGYTDLVKFFLEKDADVHEADEEGDTALLIACYNDHFNIVEILLDSGASPNVQNSEGWTPLIAATRNKNRKLAILLLDNGAGETVNNQNMHGYTALMLAVSARDRFFVRLLLQHHARPDLENDDGDTALHFAAQTRESSEDHHGFVYDSSNAMIEKRVAIIKELKKHGGDISAQNENGISPFQLATRRRSRRIIRALKPKYGIKK